MNLILIEAGDMDASGRSARITGRRFEHITKIQGAGEGDQLTVGAVDGLLGVGRVTRMTDAHLDLELCLERPPPAPLPLTAIVALPRPLILKRVLHGLTTLGVKKIVFIGARKVERSFWNSRALRPAAVREQLLLGLEQARDTRLPEVSLHPYFRPFVEKELPALQGDARCLLGVPAAAAACPLGVAGPVVLAIGPEAGFNEFEEDQLVQNGFEPVRLGERILRVDVAVTYAIAQICG